MIAILADTVIYINLAILGSGLIVYCLVNCLKGVK